MTGAKPRPKIGVLAWNQYTDWPHLRELGQQADALGYDSLWTLDHLYPITGDPGGPMLEGSMIVAGWSQHTTRATVGLMVGANTFRNPGLMVKMVTTLDHLSAGRAVLGIGAAWDATEHEAFGIEFGRSVGMRIGWLDESVEIMRGMLDHGVGTGRGEHYAARSVRNLPPPIQRHLPILIGGSGERRTLRTVARFADAWNVANLTPEEAATKDAVLRRWCDDVDRDPDEIERTVSLGPMIIRDDPAEAERAVARFHDSNPGMDRKVVTGSADEIAEHCRRFTALGFRHLIFHAPTPHDEETLIRFALEVKPRLP